MKHRCFARSVLLALMGCIALPHVAQAQEGRLPVVDNKLYPARLNPEISFMWDASLAERYTSHMGPRVSAVWHIIDMLAVELHGGYLIGSESSIMRTLRDKSLATRRPTPQPNKPAVEGREPALPGLQMLTYHLGADLWFAPVYGKLSFVGEQEGTFQFYGLAGLGIAGTRTVTDETRTGCTNMALGGVTGGCSRLMAANQKLVDLPGISPSGNDIFGPGEYQLLPLAIPVEYGMGLRLQGVPPTPPYVPSIPAEVGRWFAVRLEIRNQHWLGINNGMNINVKEDPDDEKGCEMGYRLENRTVDTVFSNLTGGQRLCYPNLHTVTLARLGVSFVIPVNSFF